MLKTIPLIVMLGLVAGCGGARKKQKTKKPATTSVVLASVTPVVTASGGVALGITRQPTLAYLEVIERSPNAKSVTRITDNENAALQIGPPIPSPVKAELIYRIIKKTSAGRDYSNIWRQKIGSYARTKITEGRSLNVTPAYSKDGEKIVFASNVTSNRHKLLRVSASGGGGKQYLTRTDSQDYMPAPATQDTIAYTSFPPSAPEPQIWTIDTKSGLPTQLREGSDPDVSPDGQKILYVRQDKQSRRFQIWQINIDGGQETQITQNTKFDMFGPRWSPDGTKIVYYSDEGQDAMKNPNFDLWMMNAGGGGKTQLTTNGSVDDYPRFSHDGQSIYFRSNRGGQWNIWRLNPR